MLVTGMVADPHSLSSVVRSRTSTADTPLGLGFFIVTPTSSRDPGSDRSTV